MLVKKFEMLWYKITQLIKIKYYFVIYNCLWLFFIRVGFELNEVP